jgi:hypothetical protein
MGVEQGARETKGKKFPTSTALRNSKIQITKIVLITEGVC